MGEHNPVIDVWVISPHYDSGFDELWTDNKDLVLEYVDRVASRLCAASGPTCVAHAVRPIPRPRADHVVLNEESRNDARYARLSTLAPTRAVHPDFSRA